MRKLALMMIFSAACSAQMDSGGTTNKTGPKADNAVDAGAPADLAHVPHDMAVAKTTRNPDLGGGRNKSGSGQQAADALGSALGQAIGSLIGGLLSGGKTSSNSTMPCPDWLDSYGYCDGDVRNWCDSNKHAQAKTCSATSGYTCSYDCAGHEGSATCCAASSIPSGCGGVSSEGECSGDGATLSYCDGSDVVTTTCGWGTKCDYDYSNGWYDCLPDGSAQTCGNGDGLCADCTDPYSYCDSDGITVHYECSDGTSIPDKNCGDTDGSCVDNGGSASCQ